MTGSGDHAGGWCFWEEWWLSNNWPTLPGIRAYDVKVKVGTEWLLVNDTYGYEKKTQGFPEDFPYYYGWHTQFNDWFVVPNQPPDIPTLNSPPDGASGVNLTPDLIFSYSDPDNDDCTKFDLKVDDNSDFSSPEIDETDYSTGGPWSSGGTITYSVSSPLSPGTKHYWKVRVFGGTVWSNWSDGTWDFTTTQPSDILAVTVYARCRCSHPDRPDPVSSYLAGILCNGYWAQGGDHLTKYYKLSSTWRDLSYTWTTNPATGEVWTQEEINSLEIGVWLWASAWTPPAYPSSWCTQVYAIVEQDEEPTEYTLRPLANGSDVGLGQVPVSGEQWDKVDEVEADGIDTYLWHTTYGGSIPSAGDSCLFYVAP